MGSRETGVTSPQAVGTHLDPSVDVSVRKAQAGDRAAFEWLVRKYARPLYSFLLVKTADPADAKDALQETLIAAWQSLPRLRHPDRFWSWLVGISINKSIDVHRQRTRHEGPPVEDARDEGGFAAADVAIVLQTLPSRLRDVLLLRYLLGLSERETAQALGINIGTVKSRSARARTRLLQSLDPTTTPSWKTGGVKSANPPQEEER